ncbi:hypothetical protein BDV96DRAFT_233210 [Lophiotrema nucula]|uniref:Uncharacterized protein n=1 Tax=Lophiotrema nucula TaxID=690887 RepID=A0A6A5YU83_9PLEO|nr:hypothetical protein BDV96DRAFT_233210 [Lophiotrema nucula]
MPLELNCLRRQSLRIAFRAYRRTVEFRALRSIGDRRSYRSQRQTGIRRHRESTITTATSRRAHALACPAQVNCTRPPSPTARRARNSLLSHSAWLQVGGKACGGDVCRDSKRRRQHNRATAPRAATPANCADPRAQRRAHRIISWNSRHLMTGARCLRALCWRES